jgi:hypothetical protein
MPGTPSCSQNEGCFPTRFLSLYAAWHSGYILNKNRRWEAFFLCPRRFLGFFWELCKARGLARKSPARKKIPGLRAGILCICLNPYKPFI